MSTLTQITAYQCKKCGRIHYPKHERCLNCKSQEFEEIHPEGEATLLTYTQIFNLPWGFDERFLYLAVVQFDNGVKAMGQIEAPDGADLELGMKLKPAWKPIRHVHGEPVYGLKLYP